MDLGEVGPGHARDERDVVVFEVAFETGGRDAFFEGEEKEHGERHDGI